MKQQFDVVSDVSDWSKYKLIILPDNILITEPIAKKVKAHLAAGKKIISSHKSGFKPDMKGFMFEKEWGVGFVRDIESDPIYFVIPSPFGKGLPDMPIALYSKGIEMAAMPKTKTFGKMIKSFCDSGWDGEHTNYYLPPYEETDMPILTVGNQVAHLSNPVFNTYYEKAPVPLRQLFANILNHFLPEPILKTKNLPSFARATTTGQPGRRMIHLLAYVPEKRGSSTEMIEEPITVSGSVVSLRQDGKVPRRVFAAPLRQELKFDIVDDYIEIKVPAFSGYSLIVVEK